MCSALDKCGTRPGMCCGVLSWWEMLANHAGIDTVWHCSDDGSDDMTLGVGDFVANFWQETFHTERVDGRTYTSMASLLARLAVVLHCVDNGETFVDDADGFALRLRGFLDSCVSDSGRGVAL